MSLISGQGVFKSYGGRHVLAGVDFGLTAGERIGLVGPNGAGKTTLLRVMAGLTEPTAGIVQRRRGLRIGYLPQDPPTFDAGTLWQAMLDVFQDLRKLQAEMDELAGRLAQPGADSRSLKRLAAVQHAFEAGGGYTIELRIKTVLTGLGFAREEYDRPLSQLSGGQRTRAMLGRLLLEELDVLLLDEPTNHLDMEAVEWLERWLGGFRNALVVVSHDRYLLDRTTAGTWEVGFGELQCYPGNYSAYLPQRQHRYDERMRVWTGQQEHIRKTEEFIRRYHAGQRAKEARGRRTRLERFLSEEAVERPREHKHIRLRLSPARRSGEMVLKARDLVVGYDAGRPLVDAGEVPVRRGGRVAVIGANGVGKTTLLRVLMGELVPLSGSAERGAGVQVGYMPQTHDELNPDQTALEAVLAAGGAGTPAEQARTLLGCFLFSDEEVFKRIGDLSGGERSRVVLATLSIQRPNLLVLDEPTNHLDIPSQEALQQVLGDFEGTVIFVTHDRYLIDALATEVWAIEGGSLHRIRGKWEDYLRWRSDRAAGVQAPRAAGPGKPRRRGRTEAAKRQRQTQRRQQKLEEEIHCLESRLHELSEAISQASVSQQLDRVHELGRQYQQADARLKQLWAEWAELAETGDGPPAPAHGAQP